MNALALSSGARTVPSKGAGGSALSPQTEEELCSAPAQPTAHHQGVRSHEFILHKG